MDSPAGATDPAVRQGYDPALLPFLGATDAACADRLLTDLLCSRVTRTIRDVVRRVHHQHRPAAARSAGQDLEDVTSEAVARVLRALRELKADAAREPIQDLEAYAARVATHACYEHFRRRYPERARLRNRVWYVMSRHPGLAIETGATGRLLCRFAAGADDDIGGHGAAAGRRSLPLLVRAVLKRHGSLDLNDLVDLVGRELGLRDGQADDAWSQPPDPGSLPDPAARAPLAALEHGQYLRRLWVEVAELPLRQRTALLLNLRDEAGDDALDLLPLTGTASLRDIARSLAIEAEELARLWPRLPLDDLEIAARLGVSRQQVINLRKAARARLGRRMAAFAGSAARMADRPGTIAGSQAASRACLDT